MFTFCGLSTCNQSTKDSKEFDGDNIGTLDHEHIGLAG